MMAMDDLERADSVKDQFKCPISKQVREEEDDDDVMVIGRGRRRRSSSMVMIMMMIMMVMVIGRERRRMRMMMRMVMMMMMMMMMMMLLLSCQILVDPVSLPCGHHIVSKVELIKHLRGKPPLEWVRLPYRFHFSHA
jgi:hypothetical protein